jgi:pimeloyl-ACP methyl ester carboxylesterase
MRHRDHFLEADRARLRIRSAGDGPAVLFLHGWALDLEMWTPQFEALASRYHLIAFDRRGFGVSSGVPGIEHDVRDIERVLAAVAVERAAVVGMSQGARVGLRWALRFPQRTSCLVLDGPPYEDAQAGGKQEIPLALYRELIRREGIEAFRKRWLEHPLMRLHTSDARMRSLLEGMVGRYCANDLAGESPPARIASLQALTTATLIINGEHDSAPRRAAGAALAHALPDARLEIVPRAGHLANLDNPGAYNALLENFFAQQAAPVNVALSHYGSPHHAE